MNPPPASPSRAIGIVANVASLLIVVGTFAGAAITAPRSTPFLTSGYGMLFGLGEILTCFACGVVAVVVFSKGSTDKTKKSSSTVGIVLSILWGLMSSLAMVLFWFFFGFIHLLEHANDK